MVLPDGASLWSPYKDKKKVKNKSKEKRKGKKLLST